MQYIYDGCLDRDTCTYIQSMNNEYSYWIEVTNDFDWQEFYLWSETGLPKYTITKRGCDGKSYPYETHKYGVIQHQQMMKYPLVPRFIGFPTESDKQKVIGQFPQWIKNKNPFKTIL